MKMRNLLMFAVGLFISLTACAQPDQRGPRMSAEDMAKRQTEMIQKATGVDDATAEKLSAVNLKFAKQMQEFRQKNSEERDAMRGEFAKIRDARDAEIKALLTEEQYAKYQKHQEEMKNRQGERQRERGPRQ